MSLSPSQPYRSHADLGGLPGYGAVRPEPEGEPADELFHAAWEPRALALTLAMGATGAWNIDQSRSARETLPNYLQLSYYQIWIEALAKLMLARGLLLPDEWQACQMGQAMQTASAEASGTAPRPLARVLRADQVAEVLARGAPTQRAAAAPARFRIGQKVQTRTQAADHHTRLPAYVRGKCGHVESIHGAHIYPDTHAQGQGEQAQWLYTVVFQASELWPVPGGADGSEGQGQPKAQARIQTSGSSDLSAPESPALSAPSAGPSHSVAVDVWEPYLSPAEGEARPPPSALAAQAGASGQHASGVASNR